MPFSTTCANNILDYLFGKVELPKISSIYLALSINDPEADNGRFDELSGNTYTRVLLPTNYGELNPMGEASGRKITNARQINWTKATAEWPEVKGFGIFDRVTQGTLLYYGKLDNPIKVLPEAVALFDPGQLQISFSTTDADLQS